VGRRHRHANRARASRGRARAGNPACFRRRRPDFQGSPQAVETVLAEAPEIFIHTTETVPRLYRQVRLSALRTVARSSGPC
jgi:lipoate synthase